MPTAIVTGGSMGLGREFTRALHELGWTVAIDARHPDALDELVSGLGGGLGGARIIAVPGDVADPDHREELVAAAAADGDLELLVNNASTLGPTPMPKLAEYPLEDWRAVFEVNVTAPLSLIQLVLPRFAAGRGRIINVSSDAAVEGYEGWGGYGASKAALDQMTRVLAAEHPGVGVYSVDPGDMATAMHQAAFPGEDISDRPPPGASVPGLLALVLGEFVSGRYAARDIAPMPV